MLSARLCDKSPMRWDAGMETRVMPGYIETIHSYRVVLSVSISLFRLYLGFIVRC